jgi:hypothetical protein
MARPGAENSKKVTINLKEIGKSSEENDAESKRNVNDLVSKPVTQQDPRIIRDMKKTTFESGIIPINLL